MIWTFDFAFLTLSNLRISVSKELARYWNVRVPFFDRSTPIEARWQFPFAAGINGPRKVAAFTKLPARCFPCRFANCSAAIASTTKEEFARDNGWSATIHMGTQCELSEAGRTSQGAPDISLEWAQLISAPAFRFASAAEIVCRRGGASTATTQIRCARLFARTATLTPARPGKQSRVGPCATSITCGFDELWFVFVGHWANRKSIVSVSSCGPLFFRLCVSWSCSLFCRGHYRSFCRPRSPYLQ